MVLARDGQQTKMTPKEKYIQTRDGLSIFTEAFGNPTDPAVILIMGAMNQGLFWYDSFCRTLAEHKFFVIRFDHRDTGFSSVVDFRKKPYILDDLAGDVIEILDGYDVSKAYVVGISMGGYIGQLLASNYLGRIETLTLISTTADHRPYMYATAGNFDKKYELPFPKQKFTDYIEQSKNNSPKNDEEFRNFQIEGWKLFFGDLQGDDLRELIRLIDLSNVRNKNKFAPFNHGLAVANSKDRLELVKNIQVPTLIIHGEQDPCFPIEHGQYLNRNIPDSRLKIMKSMGHMFTKSESGIVADIIITFLTS